ncbi:MAG TPA: isocitrate/isopropylmalate family dehydrogenase [Candidatus Paceibacterota bacterium]|nr:isocitrate/isopropylmalate family dehydrogenase [Verrucomicrobiota bacterium]HRZ46281.1 isocitrate/isopropylmalate family dehydrogenase [Candidatus Paceibacterota bacterium]
MINEMPSPAPPAGQAPDRQPEQTKVLRIAVYPGDGIGVEVIDQAWRVLEEAQARCGGFRLEGERMPWGADYFMKHGCVAPPDMLDRLASYDAILLGALGDPARLPDGVTLEPLVRIRQGFDQFACVRPSRLLPGVAAPLGRRPLIDLVVVRENTEGEYVSCGGRFREGLEGEIALETAVHTRAGIERVLRVGFNLARRRRRRLTMVTKSNALRHGMALWDECLEAVRADYPEVAADRQHADAAAMNLVRAPERFDVLVASNLFGDLLSDLAAAITGGLGLAPSANLDPSRRHPSMFEPVHGSAPDIAGRGLANPAAAILSGAMMLGWLGCAAAGHAIEAAIERALDAGHRTQDLGGTLSTAEMADRIIENLAGPP